ncbi:MAG: type II secretion system protein [Planctomycetota bacterium]
MHTAAAGRRSRNRVEGVERSAAPRRRRRAGFTMLEMLISISVLLVATVAAFGSQIASFGVIDSSRDASVAMTELEVCMERMLAISADEVVDPNGDYTAGQPVAEFNELHLSGESIVPSYPNYAGAGAPPDPLDVVLTATWLDRRGRPQRLTLSTQITR